MQNVEYIGRLPTDPPGKLFDLLNRKNALSMGALVYRVAYVKDPLSGIKTKCVQVTCSECGETWFEEYIPGPECRYSPAPFGFRNSLTGEEIISGNSTMCARCGAAAEAMHISNISAYGIELIGVYPITIQLFENKLAVFQWQIVKLIKKDGSKKIISRPWEAYIFDSKKCIKFVGYYNYFMGRTVTGKWEQRSRNLDTLGQVTKLICCLEPSLLSFSSLPDCKIDEYIRVPNGFPVTYLKLYQRHKNVENLVVQGATPLLNDFISKKCSHYGYCALSKDFNDINWKAKRPSQMLGLNKAEFRACVKLKWGSSELCMFNFIKKYDAGINLEDIKKYTKISDVYSVSGVVSYKQSPIKALNYIIKQKEKYPSDYLTFGELLDYWRMLKQQKQWTDDKEVLYPQRLKAAHDNMTAQIKEESTARFKPNFEKRLVTLNDFAWEYENLFIRPAKMPLELYLEGKDLHHCVASYIEDHAKGKTSIFFIRRKESPDTSYYTLELDVKTLTVRQNRGKNNCARTEEISIFEEKWLEHIKQLGVKNGTNNRSKECA